MSVLYIAIPVALLIALIAVTAFIIQVRNGQYDDLETPAHRMLFDDVEVMKNSKEANPTQAVDVLEEHQQKSKPEESL